MGTRDACIYIYIYIYTVVCVACVYYARLVGCEGDVNAGVGPGGGVVAVIAYMGGTCGSV